MISNRLWEILSTFYRHGTLSEAAKALYVSQPSLSDAMKRLEKDLGVTLFTRTKNRIVLNEVGREAARLAEAHIKQEESIVQQIRELDWRLHTITVASFVSGLRKDLVQRLSELYPDRNVASENLPSESLPLGLMQGRFDYVITEYRIEEPNVVCVPYVTDRLLVRLHSSDPLFDQDSVTLSDLEGSKMLVWMQSGFWAKYLRKKFSKQIQLVFVNNEQEYYDLLGAFAMRSFALETAVVNMDRRTQYRYVPLAEEGIEETFYLCCLQKNEDKIPLVLPQRRAE